jgi:hypothetical protein
MEVSIPYDVRVDPASITHRFAINLVRVRAEVAPRMRKAVVINDKCFHVVWAKALPRSGSFEMKRMFFLSDVFFGRQL